MSNIIELENFTPHLICLYKGDELVHKIPSSGEIRLVSTERKAISEWRGIPILQAPWYYAYAGIPDEFLKKDGPERNIIVSAVVAEFLKDLEISEKIHVFAPDTNPEHVVRNSTGQIIGVKALIKYR